MLGAIGSISISAAWLLVVLLARSLPPRVHIATTTHQEPLRASGGTTA